MKKKIILGVIIISVVIIGFICFNEKGYYVWKETNFEILKLKKEGGNILRGELVTELYKGNEYCFILENTFIYKSNFINTRTISAEHNVANDSLKIIDVIILNNNDSISLKKFIRKIISDSNLSIIYNDNLNLQCCDKVLNDFVESYNNSFFGLGDGYIGDFKKFGFLFTVPNALLESDNYILKLKIVFKSGKYLEESKKIKIM